MSTRNIYILGGAIIVVLAAGVFYVRNGAQSSYQVATVERGAIVQEVSASGNVEAPSTISLQFQNAGKLEFLGVESGDRVRAGETLAREDTSILNAQLRQAQAAADSQQAQLDQLSQGTRPEQIAITQSQIASDQAGLAQANQSVVNAIQTAYTQSYDAVYNKADQFFNNPRSSNPYASFASSDSQLISTLQSERVSIETVLSTWQQDTVALGASGGISAAVAQTQTNLSTMTKFLSDANSALNRAIPSERASQTTIDAWILNIANARTGVNAAVSGLTAAVTARQNAASALDTDTKRLALEQAGSTASALAAQEALAAQARANVAAIRAQIAQMALVAPVSGTVTGVTGNVG